MEFPVRTPTSLGFFMVMAALLYFSLECKPFIPLAISALMWFLIVGPSRWIGFPYWLDWLLAATGVGFAGKAICMAV